jgi:hypothetical protein
MLYFKKNQSNNIVVTWTDRATSDVAPYYILVLTHIATNFEYTIPLLKSANLSEYLERYDKFTILNEFTKEGQYKYIAYESNTSAITGVIGVVETGLAQVEVSQEAYATNAGVTTYVEYGEADTPSNPAPAPIITPLEGIYAGFVLITLTGDGSIYYTLDGSVPTAQNGTAYSEPFFVTATALVRARQYIDGATPGLIADSYYTIIPLAVSTDPEAGQYLASVEVALVANSEDAEVRFTLDGSTPTSGSTLYVAPLDVEVNTTIKAISIDPPAANSAVFEFDFDIQALAPTVAPASGTFVNEQVVVFTNPNPLGQVWASLNGGAFEVVGTETFTEITTYIAEVRADEYVTSEQVSGVVNIQCAAATFEPAGGTYDEPFELTINTTTSGSTIYYTLDGSTPTTDSLVYDPLDKPLIPLGNTEAKALVVKAGLVNSDVSTAAYLVADADVIAFLAATGIEDATFEGALQTLVEGMKDEGIFAKMRSFYPMYGANADQHKYNLIDARDLDAAFRLSFASGWSFSNQGAKPNGSTFANTFNNGQFYNTESGLSIGYVAMDLPSSTSSLVNIGSSGAQSLLISSRTSLSETRYQFPEATQLGSNNLGMHAASKLRGTPFTRVLITQSSSNSTSQPEMASISNLSFYLGAFNSAGTAVSNNDQTLNCVFIAEYLSLAELETLRTLVTAFNTTIR